MPKGMRRWTLARIEAAIERPEAAMEAHFRAVAARFLARDPSLADVLG